MRPFKTLRRRTPFRNIGTQNYRPCSQQPVTCVGNGSTRDHMPRARRVRHASNGLSQTLQAPLITRATFTGMTSRCSSWRTRCSYRVNWVAFHRDVRRSETPDHRSTTHSQLHYPLATLLVMVIFVSWLPQSPPSLQTWAPTRSGRPDGSGPPPAQICGSSTHLHAWQGSEKRMQGTPGTQLAWGRRGLA